MAELKKVLLSEDALRELGIRVPKKDTEPTVSEQLINRIKEARDPLQVLEICQRELQMMYIKVHSFGQTLVDAALEAENYRRIPGVNDEARLRRLDQKNRWDKTLNDMNAFLRKLQEIPDAAQVIADVCGLAIDIYTEEKSPSEDYEARLMGTKNLLSSTATSINLLLQYGVVGKDYTARVKEARENGQQIPPRPSLILFYDRMKAARERIGNP